MGHVFISYAREDRSRATSVTEVLRKAGFDVWIDVADLPANADISEALDRKLREASIVLVLWSRSSNGSTWVRAEAFRALELGNYLGALLEPLAPPVPFNARNAPDVSDWAGSFSHPGWNRLVTDMCSLLPEGGRAILEDLARIQKREAEERVRQLAVTQEQLPFGDEAENGQSDVSPYVDVEALVASTSELLSSSQKLDLPNAVLRSSLEAELVGRAAFIVQQNGERLSGARGSIVPTISQAIDQANDGDLIVVSAGTYDENIRITKGIRIVGLGSAGSRPIIRAKARQAVVDIGNAGRLENVIVETKVDRPAVTFSSGRPTLLNCTISRFSRMNGAEDGAIYVATSSNPVMIASSVTTGDCAGAYFVSDSSGSFMGTDFYSSRGVGVICRGRAKFQACRIEAVGRSAVEVLGIGHPTFDDCQISGRGAAVVVAKGRARPHIRDSRVVAVRQLAFDFGEEAGGRYERNVIRSEGTQPGPAKPEPKTLWDRLGNRRPEPTQAQNINRYIRHTSRRTPLFLLNLDDEGHEVRLPN